MNTPGTDPAPPCSWIPDQVRDDGQGGPPQLARSCASASTGAASSALLVSPRSRSLGEGFSPFSATLPVMSNARAASSAVGFEAPPWLMVGPPLCLVIVSLLASWLQRAIGTSVREAAERSGSDLDLAAHLDHSVGRQAEEFHRAFGVAHHPGEQFLAPDRHAADFRGERGLTREEEARLHHLERETA